jgi:hypothetical protein
LSLAGHTSRDPTPEPQTGQARLWNWIVRASSATVPSRTSNLSSVRPINRQPPYDQHRPRMTNPCAMPDTKIGVDDEASVAEQMTSVPPVNAVRTRISTT